MWPTRPESQEPSHSPAHKATAKVLGTPVPLQLLLLPLSVLPEAEVGLLLFLSPEVLLPAGGAVDGLPRRPLPLRNCGTLQQLL